MVIFHSYVNLPEGMSFDCQAKSSLLLKFFWKPQAKDKLLGKAEKGAEFWKVGPGKGSDKHQQQEAVPVSDWTHHSKKNQLKLTICLRIQKNRDQSPVGMVGIEKNDPNWHHLLLSPAVGCIWTIEKRSIGVPVGIW